jgi:hypothetical protein
MPGVKPPTGILSEEIRRPTGDAGAAGSGVGGLSPVSVTISERGLTGTPQEGQNLCAGESSPLQEGHFIEPSTTQWES